MTSNLNDPSEKIRVSFAYKARDLNEVLRDTAYASDVSLVVITHRKCLTETEYDDFAQSLMLERDWLNGLGGDINRFTRRVIEVSAPNRTTLFIDPSGYSYARYVGVRIG